MRKFSRIGTDRVSIGIRLKMGSSSLHQLERDNDVIRLIGIPHTKSIDDENLWFYFDRKVKPGSIINFKDHQLIENNVLVIKFDKFGIVEKKEFYNKDDMIKIAYTDKKTKNPVSRESFVTKFLQSVKQKMYGKRKF